ncbi:MAG: methyltransferase domain-containing protein, partial [Microcoleaceae cyanobacterium]
MKCHICQSESPWFFQTKVLNKYDVNYWQCNYCQFVQTDSPYWLDEVYSRAITRSDDGLIFRNLMLAQISKNIINSFFAKEGKFLDFGGGYGLFVRLMRDIRFTFFWQDQFCQNLFADGLESQNNLQYELITAWEVFEHFVNPLEQIEQLLKISPNILFSTEILPANNPQPDQWWYYAPHEGQHISIYTIKSLQIIAEKFGLNFYSNGNSIHLLTKKLMDVQLFEQLSQYNAQKLRQFLWQKQDYLKTLQLLENQNINYQTNIQEKQLLANNLSNTNLPYFINQQLGVNIAGFIKSELGIGEGVRSIIRAVETTDIPFVINNIDLPSHRNADTSYQKFSPDNPHPINILQINANEVNTFMKRGVLQKYLNNHYNIGFWAWELPKFPPEWVSALTPFHEIWTYSNYCADAIAQVAAIPVLRMMPSINLAIPNLTKEDLGLPKDKFIFLFMFDFFSRVQRKNPMAIIRAFKQAFDRNNQDVLLIIKCSNSQKFPAERQILIDLIDNYDSIKLIDGYFSKEQINALVYHCDSYVSLHRCEGFGLTMAEAMFYGKPVIATGYSSNIEFMNVANSFLVKYDLVEIDGNYGPYKKGDIWADAKVDHCSELMQYVVNNYESAKKIGDQAAEDMKT